MLPPVHFLTDALPCYAATYGCGRTDDSRGLRAAEGRFRSGRSRRVARVRVGPERGADADTPRSRLGTEGGATAAGRGGKQRQDRPRSTPRRAGTGTEERPPRRSGRAGEYRRDAPRVARPTGPSSPDDADDARDYEYLCLDGLPGRGGAGDRARPTTTSTC